MEVIYYVKTVKTNEEYGRALLRQSHLPPREPCRSAVRYGGFVAQNTLYALCRGGRPAELKTATGHGFGI